MRGATFTLFSLRGALPYFSSRQVRLSRLTEWFRGRVLIFSDELAFKLLVLGEAASGDRGMKFPTYIVVCDADLKSQRTLLRLCPRVRASRGAGGHRPRSHLQPPSSHSFFSSSRWHVWRAAPLVSYADALVAACGWFEREMFHVKHLYVRGKPMSYRCSSAGSRRVVTAVRKGWSLQSREELESAD